MLKALFLSIISIIALPSFAIPKGLDNQVNGTVAFIDKDQVYKSDFFARVVLLQLSDTKEANQKSDIYYFSQNQKAYQELVEKEKTLKKSVAEHNYYSNEAFVNLTGTFSFKYLPKGYYTIIIYSNHIQYGVFFTTFNIDESEDVHINYAFK